MLLKSCLVMDYNEWHELVLLEIPSIYGLAAPGAEVLDVSEPTFLTQESSESEAEFDDDDSLAG